VLGVKVFARAILVIPKVLVANAGYDSQDMVLKALQSQGDTIVGLDLETGDTLMPTVAGILDNYSVKKQIVDAR
jgi:T-complex protein 1 subunit zeta